MKVPALFKTIVKEFKRDIFISILLLALVDFIYVNFTGIQHNGESGMILWQGGNDKYPFDLRTVLLKLLNISIVFITVGKIADKISSDIILYILARITNYKKFICSYSIVIIVLGEILFTAFHLVYYCFAGVYSEQVRSCFFYYLMDVLGFLGMMILYIVLNNCYSLENSFTYMIAVYLLNTVLPVPVLPAMSTVRFLSITNQIPIVLLLLLVLGTDLIVGIFYYELIKRRRVNVC